MKALFTVVERCALFEASYAFDTGVRADANVVWDSIVSYIQDQAEKDFYGLVKDPYGLRGYVVYPLSTKLPPDLRLVLAPKGAQSKLSPLKSGGFVIVIGDVLVGERDTTYLETRITAAKTRKIFVHEYVHYLDSRRNPVLVRSGAQAARSSQAGQPELYFRTPEEFNAWFQGTAQEIEASIDTRIEAARAMLRMGRLGPEMAEMKINHLKQEFATFPDFLHMVSLESWEADKVLQHLKGTKWERKWLKRLAVFYRGLKSRVMERIKEVGL